ncbi:MAG: Fe-S cluster assembly protein SufD [Planctomycetota bacterium]
MIQAVRMPPGPGTDWAAEFARHEREILRREPDELLALRRAALRRFLATGYPTRREEAWRYADLAAIARTAFTLPAGRPPRRAAEEVLARALLPGAVPLVFVDGGYAGGASGPAAPVGVEVANLAGRPAEAARAETRIAGILAADDRPFVALNTAFFGDGALVRVRRGAHVEIPIQILFVASGGEKPLAIHPRVLLVLEEGARATVVESFAGASAVRLTNAVTEVRLGRGAILDRYYVQDEGAQALHVHSFAAELAGGAALRSHGFALGSALSRAEIDVEFAGPEGEAVLGGLWAVDGDRHADCRTFVDHGVPHCTSEQAFRGILGGAGRGVFQGRVRMREGARGSRARQATRSLLLSRAARADTKPELEIRNDDVQCSHGATVGQLDEEPPFYLRSRGIDAPAARAMLALGFARAVLDDIRVPALAARIEGALQRWLGDRLSGAGIPEEGAP